MNPYDIDVEGLHESAEIKDEKELLKLRLTAEFLRITAKMPTDEVLAKTGLHKSDLSRLRTFSLSRFTIDRIITLLDALGYTTSIKVKVKAAG
jgi:predicted XRE-type DNA-binding protein